jgi:tetratricopeptide (TPR) repeat protein/predicted Ser/Thr protein kinase
MGCSVSEERLWSWIDRGAPELEAHLAQCPHCRALAEGFRGGIKAVTDGSPRVSALPGRIGSYPIKSLLGEGGQGVVYKAEQQSPRRAVALKVLKGGRLVGEDGVRHFQREIQTLAALNHPAIATIYEGGRTTEGQHFFAMELVDGLPLDTFVRERELPLRERLELFCKVCDGVEYAHAHGVIHRDLKPANILVTAAGAPKILDFGLARLTNTDVTLTQSATQTGQIIGTLRYMSPGQARGDPAQIDERTDVYSLGAILYELLTGRSPYDELNSLIPEAVHTICETPPRRPSSTIGWDGRPARHLRGDLDTVVLKALEKDAGRRYRSVADLAGDLRRYRQGEPIRAQPPSRFYVIRKRLSKRRRAIGTEAAAVVLAVAVVVLALSWRQRALDEETLRLTTECMLRARAGQLEQALAACTAIIESKRRLPDSSAFRLRADVNVALRRYDAAIADYTAGCRLRPDNPWYYYLRATPLWITGRHADAANDYRRFRGLTPGVSYADARLFLVLRDEAGRLEQLGRTGDAQATAAEADQVLSAARRAVEKRAWLGEILACLGGDREPAALVEAAAERDPKRRCEAWFYAAECCRRRGQLEQAREWYQSAAATGLVFDPEAPTPAPMAEYHLAIWRLGQLTEDGRPRRDGQAQGQ